MKDIAYDRVEYILYNYTRINEIIEEIKQDIIDSTNVSSNAWLKGKISDSNTVNLYIGIKKISCKKDIFILHEEILRKKPHYLHINKDKL